jgi:hypothetical protein
MWIQSLAPAASIRCCSSSRIGPSPMIVAVSPGTR